MSRPQASTRVDRQKIIAAIVLLLIVGYVVGRPTFERWLGQPLPSFGFDGNEQTAERTNKIPDQPATTPGSGHSRLPPDRDAGRSGEQAGGGSREVPGRSSQEAARGAPDSGRSGQPDSEFFQPAGGRRLRSPAGLVYGTGPGGEHRCDHVLEHGVDDPSRPVHGVFDGTRNEIFALIDEAWLLAQKGGRGVQKTDGDDGRVAYTVRFDRPIGHEGGQRGRERGFPKLNRIKLIVEDEDELITAYPVR
jgi:hypothetical protein